MYLANMGGAKILNSKTFHIFSLGLQLTVDLLNILVIKFLSAMLFIGLRLEYDQNWSKHSK